MKISRTFIPARSNGRNHRHFSLITVMIPTLTLSFGKFRIQYTVLRAVCIAADAVSTNLPGCFPNISSSQIINTGILHAALSTKLTQCIRKPAITTEHIHQRSAIAYLLEILLLHLFNQHRTIRIKIKSADTKNRAPFYVIFMLARLVQQPCRI